jgi:hypothetical protein
MGGLSDLGMIKRDGVERGRAAAGEARWLSAHYNHLGDICKSLAGAAAYHKAGSAYAQAADHYDQGSMDSGHLLMTAADGYLREVR